MSGNLIIFYDFETTGLNYFHDEIIEYAFLTENGEILTNLVRPVRKLDKKITAITGITQEKLNKEKLMVEQFSEILAFFTENQELLKYDRYFFVAHNNDGFDKFFLKRLFSNNQTLCDIFNSAYFIDSLHLARFAMPRMRSHSQKTLAKCFSLDNGNHRALGDAMCLKNIYGHLIDLIGDRFRDPMNVYNLLYTAFNPNQ